MKGLTFPSALAITLFSVTVGLAALSCVGCGSGSDSSGPLPAREACGVIGLTTRSSEVLSDSFSQGNESEVSLIMKDASIAPSIPKIINGTRCSSVNSSVVFLVNGKNNQPTSLCSGTAIGETSVVSAAHCFVGQDYDRVAIASGDPLMRITFTTDIATHPGYRQDLSKGVYVNDVAILKTSVPLGLPKRSILGSRLVSKDDIISIFGYGQREEGTSDAARGSVAQLLSGQMKVSVVDAQFFAAEFGNAGSNTCFGDSGGPAFVQLPSGEAVIAGVTSAGTAQGCESGDVSDFTNFTDPVIRSFIQANVRDVTIR
jgi:secreted trypsin-like serine protease